MQGAGEGDEMLFSREAPSRICDTSGPPCLDARNIGSQQRYTEILFLNLPFYVRNA